jgi:hypothetical protein
MKQNPFFDGAVNIGRETDPPLKLKLLQSGESFFKQMHIPKANQLLWNSEEKVLYYLNKDRVLFEVLFKEVPTSSVPSVSSVVKS